MSAQYRKGREDALESLGLRSRSKDNEQVTKFLAGLGDDDGVSPKSDSGGNRPLHRQSWGKTVDYSTSDQIFSGGGTRL